MDMPDLIETQRLKLIKPKPTFALANEIWEVVNLSRKNLRRWLPWVDGTLTPEDEFASFLNGYCVTNWQKRSGFPYIIRLKENGEFVGCVDLMHVDDTHKTGEIGYWLGDAAVGHGYIQEAVLALEKAGFAGGLNRIVILNDTRNSRSVNVAVRCGYHLDGIMRQDRWNNHDQIFVDSNVFSKLKSEC